MPPPAMSDYLSTLDTDSELRAFQNPLLLRNPLPPYTSAEGLNMGTQLRALGLARPSVTPKRVKRSSSGFLRKTAPQGTSTPSSESHPEHESSDDQVDLQREDRRPADQLTRPPTPVRDVVESLAEDTASPSVSGGHVYPAPLPGDRFPARPVRVDVEALQFSSGTPVLPSRLVNSRLNILVDVPLKEFNSPIGRRRLWFSASCIPSRFSAVEYSD